MEKKKERRYKLDIPVRRRETGLDGKGCDAGLLRASRVLLGRGSWPLSGRPTVPGRLRPGILPARAACSASSSQGHRVRTITYTSQNWGGGKSTSLPMPILPKTGNVLWHKWAYPCIADFADFRVKIGKS